MSGDVSAFDRFATAYDLVMPPARVGKLRAGLAVAERDVARVVDIGGGSGRGIRRLDVPERIVVDAAPGMLRRARDRGLATVAGDAARLPLCPNSADAAVIVDALHHMHDVDAVFRAAASVVRPGGVLVVREFDPTTLLGRFLVASEHLVGFESEFYTPDELVARLADAGLTGSVVERGFGYTVAGVVDSGGAKYPHGQERV